MSFKGVFLLSIVFFAASVSLASAPKKGEPEVFSYISCGTFEYNGKTNFRVQNAGLIDVMRQKIEGDDFSYTFMTRTKMMVGEWNHQCRCQGQNYTSQRP